MDLSMTIFALRTGLEDTIRHYGCTVPTIINWIDDSFVIPEAYLLGVTMIAKSVLIVNPDGENELVIADDESVLTHYHIMEAPIAEKAVYLRVYTPGKGYSRVNIFTKQVEFLGNKKKKWDWYK